MRWRKDKEKEKEKRGEEIHGWSSNFKCQGAILTFNIQLVIDEHKQSVSIIDPLYIVYNELSSIPSHILSWNQKLNYYYNPCHPPHHLEYINHMYQRTAVLPNR